jgi:hypothetical protein
MSERKNFNDLLTQEHTYDSGSGLYDDDELGN